MDVSLLWKPYNCELCKILCPKDSTCRSLTPQRCLTNRITSDEKWPINSAVATRQLEVCFLFLIYVWDLSIRLKHMKATDRFGLNWLNLSQTCLNSRKLVTERLRIQQRQQSWSSGLFMPASATKMQASNSSGASNFL